MSEPTTPPVPPLPEPGQPAPRFGEFAPVEPVAAPVPPAAVEPPAQPVAAPGYPPYPEAPAAAAPAIEQPGPAQPGYGQPGYGQPGYGQAGYAQPVYGQPGFGAAPRKRRVWDLILTIVLLVLGVVGLVLGLIYAWIFSSQEFLDQLFQQQGLGTFDGVTGGASGIILVSHLALYVIALGLSILLLVKRRIAFYVPLSAGVIAAIIFWVVAFSVFLSDPDFITAYS